MLMVCEQLQSIDNVERRKSQVRKDERARLLGVPFRDPSISRCLHSAGTYRFSSTHFRPVSVKQRTSKRAWSCTPESQRSAFPPRAP